MLDRYLEFKVFELFRDKLVSIIQNYNSADDFITKDLYSHVFLAPENYSEKRSFQVVGAQYPFVALWATSPLQYNKSFYGKSVLPVDISYVDSAGDTQYTRGFFYDYEKDFELTAASYYKDFVGEVNQTVTEIDRLRYFDVDMSQLVPSYVSRVELMNTGLVSSDSVDEASSGRKFMLSSKYKVKATMFVPQDFTYLKAINLYLNSNLIYQK